MSVLDLFRLDGKIAVVTGAGKDVGRGISRALAEAGAHLVVNSRTAVDLDSLVQEIRRIGRRAIAVPGDVTGVEQLHHLADRAMDTFGRIDIWINNAGELPDNTPSYRTRSSGEDWALPPDVNSNALWAGCVEAAARMEEQGGVIVNIASRASRDAKNGSCGGSRGMVNSLTATFARELAPKIRVNAVAMGPVPAPEDQDRRKAPSPEQKAARELMALPMQRWGTSQDIGAAVVYMSSPASSWVTGHVLCVTGGS